MENYGIAHKQITALSSFCTSKSDLNQPEYRWPHRGRLNTNTGGTAWVPALFETAGDWFQVDLGKMSDIRCFALQGRDSHKKQFVRQFKFGYSVDGGSWKYALTNYQHTVNESNYCFICLHVMQCEVSLEMPKSS